MAAWKIAAVTADCCSSLPRKVWDFDGLYVALLAAAWFTRSPHSGFPPSWQTAVVILAFMAGVAAGITSLPKALVDLALLRVGRSWRRNWLKDFGRDVTSGEHFVVFLSRDCPYCKRWVPLLNVIEVQPTLPSVVGVMSLEGEQLKGFLGEHMIRFPIAHMPQSLVSLMVSAYPTAALIQNGKVMQKWVGEMPKEYLERIQQFFEAIAPPKKKATSFSG